MVVSLALLAALANAVASICQRLGVEDAPHGDGPCLGLVRHMVQRPVWLLGFAIMAAGYACQAVALHLGAIDVVQPMLVTELVILVVVLWLWYATPISARDLASAVATAGGLGAFLALASPKVGSRVPGAGSWLATGLGVSWSSWRSRGPAGADPGGAGPCSSAPGRPWASRWWRRSPSR